MPKGKATSPAKKVVKKKAPAKGHKLPDPLPKGLIFTDTKKQKWRLGTSIGTGGFGEIYLASDDISKDVNDKALYVVKVEHHSNGPLFTEMHCYQRVAKEEDIDSWIKKKKLDYLGVPKYISSGSFEHNNVKYRFMIMNHFGSDLQKIFVQNKKQFSLKTTYTLGIRILDALEYIHSQDYIHGDIKAANLLLGFGKGKENEVYLVDFGIACKYKVDGKHKAFKEDPRKAHNGTIEFLSRDAHIGAFSCRGDLEILGYNMLQWLCGSLSWEENLASTEYVSKSKFEFMNNIPAKLKKHFHKGHIPEGITEYFQYVADLDFEGVPDYALCRNILKTAITRSHFKYDKKLVFSCLSPAKNKSAKDDAQANHEESPPKRPRKNKDNLESSNEISVENPTPAMLMVMQKCTPKKSKKRENSSESLKENSLNNPTPAMLSVMKNSQHANKKKKLL